MSAQDGERRIQAILEELRARKVSLTRAAGWTDLRRLAAELGRRHDLEPAIVLSLMRDELGLSVPDPGSGVRAKTPTRPEIPAQGGDDDDDA